MDVVVGAAVTKRSTFRVPLQLRSKNKTMKSSQAVFAPHACDDNAETNVKLDCMDCLFNFDNSSVENKSDLETMFVNLMAHDKVPVHIVTAHVRAIVEHLQLEVNLDINDITLHLENTKMLQDQLGWKEKMLNEELKAVKNDTSQYEWYINDQQYYDFKNETWESLINLGRDELQKRWMKLQQMKSDLKNQYQVVHQRMKICHHLLWTLNNEDMRRQQRLHMLSFYSHKEINLSHIITNEAENLRNIKSAFDKSLKNKNASVSPLENNVSSILKQQKLGCTFEFVLHHRVNKGGSVDEYNDVINIFEKKVPEFEFIVNCGKTKKLVDEILKKQMSRLDREHEIYSLNMFSADSDSQTVNGVPLSSSNELFTRKSHPSETNVPDFCVLSQKKDDVNTALDQTQNLSVTYKKQESEGYLFSNFGQNNLKTTSRMKAEDCKKQTEKRCNSGNLILQSNCEQDMKQKVHQHKEKRNQKKSELCSEQNKTDTINSTGVKILKEMEKNKCNRYGLRSDSEPESGLHSESEHEGIGCDIKSNIEQLPDNKTIKINNDKDQDGSDRLNANKRSLEKKKDGIRKSSEGNEPMRLVPISASKNKTVFKKIDARIDSLEKLVQETNLELSNIKEGTAAFQRSVEDFKVLLQRNEDCKLALRAKTCKHVSTTEQRQDNEEKRSDLLNFLKTMYTFLKRSNTFQDIIEERELLLSDLEVSLSADGLEALILRAAADIQDLPLCELQQMQTKDLKLKDISKILAAVQDMIWYEEEEKERDCSCGSASSM